MYNRPLPRQEPPRLFGKGAESEKRFLRIFFFCGEGAALQRLDLGDCEMFLFIGMERAGGAVAVDLRAPVCKNQTNSKFRGKGGKCDFLHILMLHRPGYN